MTPSYGVLLLVKFVYDVVILIRLSIDDIKRFGVMGGLDEKGTRHFDYIGKNFIRFVSTVILEIYPLPSISRVCENQTGDHSGNHATMLLVFQTCQVWLLTLL